MFRLRVCIYICILYVYDYFTVFSVPYSISPGNKQDKTKIFAEALLNMKGIKYQSFLTKIINIGYSTYVSQI